MRFPRLTSVALGIGIIALSALGTVAWKSSGSLWRAQLNNNCSHDVLLCSNGGTVSRVAPDCDFAECPFGGRIQCPTLMRLCGDQEEGAKMTGPNCDIVPPCLEFCGNGVTDEWELCGEPGLSCPAGKNCVGCTCIPVAASSSSALSVIQLPASSSSAVPVASENLGTCGNWVLDQGETCEVGVCCPSPQSCNVNTCRCEYPTL